MDVTDSSNTSTDSCLLTTQDVNDNSINELEDKAVLSIDDEHDDNNNSENDEEDDPVIKTIPVYINRISQSEPTADITDSNPSLFLLQYPLRPVYRPYGDQGRLMKIKYRPQQRTFRFEYNLNTDSENFDENQRETVQSNPSESSKNPSHPVKSDSVPHILHSVPCISPHSSYGVGILRGNRLYITPVSSILQCRPDFSHLDEEAEVARRRADTHLASSLTTRTDNSENNEVVSDHKKNITQISSVGTDTKHSLQSIASHNHQPIPNSSEWHRYPPAKIRDFILSEPWIDIESFFDSDSPESYELLHLLTTFQIETQSKNKSEETQNNIDTKKTSELSLALCNEESESKTSEISYQRVSGGASVQNICFSGDFKSYLNRLCSIQDNTTTNLDLSASGPLSYLALSRLPIEQQVLRIMQHRHVESMDKIHTLLTHRISDDDLVISLRTYADFILGNWVCKSPLVYEGLVAYCRDVLLFLLSTGRAIVRDSVKPYMGNLSVEMLTTLLKEVADYKNNAWHFKLLPNRALMEKYPQLVKDSSEKFGKEQMKATIEKIQAISNAQKEAQNKTSKEGNDTTTGNALAVLDSDTFNKALKEAFKIGGAQRIPSLLSHTQTILRQNATTLQPAAQRVLLAGASALTIDDLSLVLPRLAEDIGCGLWALRKTGSPQLDRHRDLVLSIFKKQTLTPNLPEIQRGLSRIAILQEFQNNKVKFDLPDFAFRKLMKEFAINTNGFWVFKGFIPEAPATDTVT